IEGFILVLFTSTILNFSLSMSRLLKVTKLDFSILNWIIKPSFSIFISTFFIKNLFDYLNIDLLIAEGVLSLIIYITLLFLFK
ncbi:MAG: hypothetical protein ACI4PU_08480, partial [Intestinibacter sp.]